MAALTIPLNNREFQPRSNSATGGPTLPSTAAPSSASEDPDDPHRRRRSRGKCQARPIIDPETVNDIFQQFQAKYGADVDRYCPKRDVAVEVPLT
jgi:hypothetical protein